MVFLQGTLSVLLFLASPHNHHYLKRLGCVAPEDCGTVVCDLDLSLVSAHAPEDLVHSPGSQGGLDEVTHGHGANEG